jgi:hypothetical protein
MATLEHIELENHRHQIAADVKGLVEKYRAIFDWDVPEINQHAADRLICCEIGKALDAVEDELLAGVAPSEEECNRRIRSRVAKTP